MQPKQPDPSQLDGFLPLGIPLPNAPADEQALMEAGILFAKKQADHTRSELVKDVFNWSIIALIVLAGVLAATSLSIRTLHLLLPRCWLWIDSARIDVLDHLGQLIVTGALGGVAYKYFNKQIDN